MSVVGNIDLLPSIWVSGFGLGLEIKKIMTIAIPMDPVLFLLGEQSQNDQKKYYAYFY